MANEGKKMLEALPTDVKGQICSVFGSIDEFYGYTYYLGKMERQLFQKEGSERIAKAIEDVKQKLEDAGLDFMLADDLVNDITFDYSENLQEAQMTAVWGPDWKSIIATKIKELGL